MSDEVKEQLRKAVALTKEKDYDAARRVYERVLDMESDNALGWYGVGFCDYKTGNLSQAVSALARAAELGHEGAARLLPRASAKLTALEEPEAEEPITPVPPVETPPPASETDAGPVSPALPEDTSPPIPGEVAAPRKKRLRLFPRWLFKGKVMKAILAFVLVFALFIGFCFVAPFEFCREVRFHVVSAKGSAMTLIDMVFSRMPPEVRKAKRLYNRGDYLDVFEILDPYLNEGLSEDFNRAMEAVDRLDQGKGYGQSLKSEIHPEAHFLMGKLALLHRNDLVAQYEERTADAEEVLKEQQELEAARQSGDKEEYKRLATPSLERNMERQSARSRFQSRIPSAKQQFDSAIQWKPSYKKKIASDIARAITSYDPGEVDEKLLEQAAEKMVTAAREGKYDDVRSHCSFAFSGTAKLRRQSPVPGWLAMLKEFDAEKAAKLAKRVEEVKPPEINEAAKLLPRVAGPLIEQLTPLSADEIRQQSLYIHRRAKTMGSTPPIAGELPVLLLFLLDTETDGVLPPEAVSVYEVVVDGFFRCLDLDSLRAYIRGFGPEYKYWEMWRPLVRFAYGHHEQCMPYLLARVGDSGPLASCLIEETPNPLRDVSVPERNAAAPFRQVHEAVADVLTEMVIGCIDSGRSSDFDGYCSEKWPGSLPRRVAKAQLSRAPYLAETEDRFFAYACIYAIEMERDRTRIITTGYGPLFERFSLDAFSKKFPSSRFRGLTPPSQIAVGRTGSSRSAPVTAGREASDRAGAMSQAAAQPVSAASGVQKTAMDAEEAKRKAEAEAEASRALAEARAVEREFLGMLDEMDRQIEEGRLSAAYAKAKELLKRARRDAMYSEFQATAEEYLAWIDLARNPSERFSVKSVFKGGDVVAVWVEDQAYGEVYKLQVGDLFADDFSLRSFDPKKRLGVIVKEGKEYEIYKK
jgi:tetratricopeptide (TPR) repeat protein